jgi:hypothetical protein
MDNAYGRMLDSLRDTLNQKLPSGLTPAADSRLQRTLRHFMQEVQRVRGSFQEKEVLRTTYDSMVAWFRSHKSQLVVEQKSNHSPAAFETLPVNDELAAILQKMREGPKPSPVHEEELAIVEPRMQISRPIQQMDLLPRQESIVKYREVENNLVLNSKDRDWLHSLQENRYNFSVQLDAASRPQGTGLQAVIQNRFRNIVRLEFVKAVLPVEGLDVVITKECDVSGAYIADKSFYSALALPYVNLMLEEYQSNNFGTDSTIDKSFAVMQYDATWRSDNYHSRTNTNRGYTLFFPKFMKAQRTYAPTPLASLQKLSFRLQNPENALVSCGPDAAILDSIVFGKDASGCYYDSSSNYIFLKTAKWFPLWSFSQIDRILIAGLPTSLTDIRSWLEDTAGHIVVGTAYDDAGGITDGWNDCGYANYIIIRNRFTEPTAGGCAREPFTPEDTIPLTSTTAGVLNLSRQVQLFLRVITRELDPTTNVRPDNI